MTDIRTDIREQARAMLDLKCEFAHYRTRYYSENTEKALLLYEETGKKHAAAYRDWKPVAIGVAQIGLNFLSIAVMAAPELTTTKMPGWISDVCSSCSPSALANKAPLSVRPFINPIVQKARLIVDYWTPEGIKNLSSVKVTPHIVEYLRRHYPPDNDANHPNILNGIDYNKVASGIAGLLSKGDFGLQYLKQILDNFDQAKRVEAKMNEDLAKMNLDQKMRDWQSAEAAEREANQARVQRDAKDEDTGTRIVS